MTADNMRELLAARYAKGNGRYVLAFEVNEGTGTAQGRRADAIVMACWPSDDYKLSGFEIKVSRSDWLHELKQVDKSEGIGKYCDHWWIVAPKGIVKLDELPTGWGLLEPSGTELRAVQHAAKRKPVAPSVAFLASLLRNVSSGTNHATEVAAFLRGQAEGQKRAELTLERANKNLKDTREQLQQLQALVSEFQRETGIPLTSSGSWRAHKVPPAKAVRFVMDGGMDGELARVAQLASGIGQAHQHLTSVIENMKEQPNETT